MAKKLDPVINPIDGEKVKGNHSRKIRNLRKVRNNSRKKMRSGNPAVRADAARVNAQVPEMLRDTYREDFADRNDIDFETQ